MLDHLTLHVKDIDRSITFYKQALAPLGYIVKAHHEPTLGFGVDDGTLHSDFYVSPIEGLEAEASPVTPVTQSRSWLTVSKPCRRSMQPRSPPAAETTALPVRARTIPAITPHSCWTRMAITSKPSWIGLIRTSKNISVSCLRRHRRRRLQPVGFVVATAV